MLYPIDISETVKAIQQDKNISEDLVLKTIEDTLLAAFKRRFGTSDNAVVQFTNDNKEVNLFASKIVVEDDDWDDDRIQIEITDAKKMNEDAEIGDEILIPINTKEFDRSEVQTAKQKVRGDLKEIQKDVLYSEFKDKKGEIIIGYCKRENRGNIFVDLGSTEGMLPKRFQSAREIYKTNDRIKALIWDVQKTTQGLSLVLSRTHAEFVKRILELEVPELYDGTIKIERIVREAGYRTKLAVSTTNGDIDPVGACVGPKGIRIQNVVREFEGEKIDILHYSTNPAEFIANALSPATVDQVIIVDSEKRMALAVVEDSQLSLAIGKQGSNVRLANRLVDWSIDVKTRSQFEEMDIIPEASHSANQYFTDYSDNNDIENIAGLEGRIAELLRENGIRNFEDLLDISTTELAAFRGITEADIAIIMDVVQAKANDYEETDSADEYECPECGAAITLDVKQCPNCGVDLEFEEE